MLRAQLGDGTVTFTPTDGGMHVHVDTCIEGLQDGWHGFHVHASGDLGNQCMNTGPHYGEGRHGALHDTERHAGDLGNVASHGTCVRTDFFAPSLDADIEGRGLVIHAKRDDLGRGGNAASKTNGNAGARVACAVINKNIADKE